MVIYIVTVIVIILIIAVRIHVVGKGKYRIRTNGKQYMVEQLVFSGWVPLQNDRVRGDIMMSSVDEDTWIRFSSEEEAEQYMKRLCGKWTERVRNWRVI